MKHAEEIRDILKTELAGAIDNPEKADVLLQGEDAYNAYRKKHQGALAKVSGEEILAILDEKGILNSADILFTSWGMIILSKGRITRMPKYDEVSLKKVLRGHDLDLGQGISYISRNVNEAKIYAIIEKILEK